MAPRPPLLLLALPLSLLCGTVRCTAQCPGGSMTACMAACPTTPAAAYQACMRTCADACGGAPSPPGTPAPPPPGTPAPPAPAGCGDALSVASSTVSNQGKFAVWDAALGVLLWVDSPAFTPAWVGSIVYAFRPADGTTAEIMRFDEDIVGSVMPRKGGGIVIAVSKKDGEGYSSTFCSIDVDNQTLRGSNLKTLASLPPGSPGKFNNGNCDPAGRYWAGTYTSGAPTGAVWVAQRAAGGGYNVSEGITGISHPNGLVWNENFAGSYLLFSNTGEGAVLRYPYSVAKGVVTGPAERIVSGISGVVDSICGLADGSLLLTQPGKSRVVRYAANGDEGCTISVPSSFVASCAFGGDAWGDLFVPTGRNGGGGGGPAGELYRTSGLGAGVPATPCDI